MDHLQAIILAAGKSRRFTADTTKLCASVCGQPLITYPLRALKDIPTTLVVGHQKELVIEAVSAHASGTYTYREQHEQHGTGHAVMCSASTWYAEDILIMNGDAPLVTHELIQELYRQHCAHQATVSFVTAIPDAHVKHQYGKVVHNQETISITEAHDYEKNPLESCCINAGIYIIKKDFLKTTSTPYITDVIARAHEHKLPVYVHHAPFDTVRGINTFGELVAAEQILRKRIIDEHIARDVYFEQPHTTLVDVQVEIEPGAHIGAGAILTGKTYIGKSAHIGAYSTLHDARINDHATILSHCVIKDSLVKSYAQVGPFAHLRNSTMLDEYAVIGNFVETSASIIGTRSKAKHLSYIGNAHLGEHVNIGAGTITCNYNGVTKNTTTIENHVHIGSNNCLIAPVTIGHDAVTAAGSVITDDVPPYALAIARARQITKEQYTQNQNLTLQKEIV